MKTQCKNKHWYDDQITTFCPDCPVEGLPKMDTAPNAKRNFAQAAASEFKVGGKRTIAHYPGLDSAGGKQARVDPVVGWLVAAEGPSLGRDFRIHWGQNSIGREPEQMISVSDDQSIHKKNHAFITYDPETHEFIVRPGDQQGLVKVNGRRVDSFVILEPYSTIELGRTKLVFVPLCGQFGDAFFKWDFDSKQKGQDSQM